MTVFVGNGREGIAVEQYMPRFNVVTAGDSVQFVNPYDEIHTVTFLAGKPAPANTMAPVGSPAGGTFDPATQISSGRMAKDARYTLTFPTPGRYEFVCLIHTTQSGVVTVLPAGQAAVPTAAEREYEQQQALNQGVAAGKAAAAAVSPPARTRNADGTSTWSIPNSPATIPLPGGSADVMQFIPAKLSVGLNDTVVWNNTTGTPHTVTFGGPVGAPQVVVKPSPAFDGSGYVNSGFMGTEPGWLGGTRFSLTFTKAGTYNYICILHVAQGMAGVIEVGAPGSGGITPPSTGDGGLLGGSDRRQVALLYAPLLAIALALSAGAAAALRARGR